jgi:hypothetical protein
MNPMMKKAMANLRWVAFEEYTYKTDESEDEEVRRANDITESTETDDKTEDDVSDSAEFESQG